jgi:AAA15 family ATPase/GTPase
MLIEFRVQNFRSFKDWQTFSMVSAAQPEHLESNTFDSGLRGFDRLLRTAVVFGPNAAGKTNLMRALQFVQSFVLTSASAAGSRKYPYSPFKLSKATLESPSEFEITFVQDGVRYEYGFNMGPNQIEKEWLIQHAESPSRTRSRMLYERVFNRKKKEYDWNFSSFLKGPRATWVQSTREDALFLSIATQLNSTQLRPVFDWFQKKLVVIVDATQMNQSLTLNLWKEADGKTQLLPFLKEADLGIVDVSIQEEPLPSVGGLIIRGAWLNQKPGSSTPDVVRVTLSHTSDDPAVPVAFDFEDESSGTRLLFLTAGAWLNVLKNGEILLFDEIDTNMHPQLLLFLIRKFHSDTTNPHNAQLICTTHNTSLLDRDIFRRDQFWFVEKQRTGSSKLYPLTDFSPRNDEVIERWYMRGRYGALPILPTN